MKADFQKLSSKSQNRSFNDFWVKVSSFGFHWHYHPEIEICYVKHGRGKRIIGESIEGFEDGDLVLVGSNIPHSWITDEEFNTSSKQIEVYVIQFDQEIFNALRGLPEFGRIQDLLQAANKGIKFDTKYESELIDLLYSVESETGFKKLLSLMDLLHAFSISNHKEVLNQVGYKVGFHKHQEERIMKVCNYIHEHYREPITISNLASLIAMNDASFCRFFKRTLGKTVIEYVTALRTSHICNQVGQSSIPVYQIAYDSGFSSIAHFNKQFKKIVGKTPSAYREMLQA